MAYTAEDTDLVEDIKRFLTPLLRQNPSIMLYDIEIVPGMETESEKEKHLLAADIILLMVSSYFLASDYSYSKQVLRAVERHDRHEAWVIPIILRPCLWEAAKFGKLEPLPKNRKPVTDSYWRPKDKGRLEVAKGIQKAVNYVQKVIPIHRPSTEESAG